MARNYTIPKLYIPKGKDGRPTLKRRWYVYFYYRNPETGKFDSRSKFMGTHGINRYYKDVEGRKAYGRGLVETYLKMLEQGYDPYTNTIPAKGSARFEMEGVSLSDAVERAMEEKRLTWNEKTYRATQYRVDEFLSFARANGFADMPSTMLKRTHVTEFLKSVKERGLSLTSVNNYRNVLSGVLSQMVENRHLEYNYCNDIKKERAKPLKNHPFTPSQVADIRKYLEGKDPYLLDYIRMISYGFLRNSEVVRLKVGGVDLKERIISVRTKTTAVEKVYIIDQLMPVLEAMELHRYDPEDYVFTRWGKPGKWGASLSTKKKFFSDGFRAVKERFNLGKEYTLYSFRHTFAVNVYNGFIDQGMSETEALMRMMPITRHKTMEMASNYVREKRSMLPKNYSGEISLDL